MILFLGGTLRILVLCLKSNALFGDVFSTNCFYKLYLYTLWIRLFIHTQISTLYMGVSKNRGTPKSSILIGFSIINHPFWGTPIFGSTLYIYIHIASYVFFKATLQHHAMELGCRHNITLADIFSLTRRTGPNQALPARCLALRKSKRS